MATKECEHLNVRILDPATGEIHYLDQISEVSLSEVSLDEDTGFVSFFEPIEEFTLNAAVKWPRKFGKKQLKWYRRYLGVDLLSQKFPNKKRRRAKRLNRRMKNG